MATKIKENILTTILWIGVLGVPLFAYGYVPICMWISATSFYNDPVNVAAREFRAAVERNDPNAALEWAQKSEVAELARHKRDSRWKIEPYAASVTKRTKNRATNRRATCYELLGDYDKALEATESLDDSYYETGYFNLNLLRLQYKQGDKKSAFTGYCDYARKFLGDSYNKNWLHDSPGRADYMEPEYVGFNEIDEDVRERCWAEARREITLETDFLYMRLTAFWEYADFLRFMEEEYKALGEPQEYADAMEFFRDVERNKTVCDRLVRSSCGGAASIVAERRAELEAERAANVSPDAEPK